jgi:hypothetical protein
MSVPVTERKEAGSGRGEDMDRQEGLCLDEQKPKAKEEMSHTALKVQHPCPRAAQGKRVKASVLRLILKVFHNLYQTFVYLSLSGTLQNISSLAQ